MALVVDERNRMGWVRLTPWFATEPWRSAVIGPGRDPAHPGGPGPGRRSRRDPPALDNTGGPVAGFDLGM
jgi:hypothetical protein